MNKKIGLLLVTVSCGAFADWVEFDRQRDRTAYYDPSTLRKAGDNVKMWTLYDHVTGNIFNGRQYMSTKVQVEYGCRSEKVRLLYSSIHSGSLGGGETLLTNSTPSNWEPFGPGEIYEVLWKLACKR